MLIKLAKAKKGIEIGTFTGYSALCMAEALPDDGKLYTIEKEDRKSTRLNSSHRT